MDSDKQDKNHLADAASEAARREEMLTKDPEPSLARRFGQIGILGWMTVIPVLGALSLGHALDRVFHTGITFTAAFTMLGAVIGLWLAFRWMHQQ